MNIVKSAMGEAVDFDLLRMKEQLASKPKEPLTDARQKAVSAKRRRGSGKVLQSLLDTMKDEDSDQNKKHPSKPEEEMAELAPEPKIKIAKVKRDSNESIG